MNDPSTVWSGRIRGHDVVVRGSFEDTSSTGADPTLLRPHRLQVTVDGEEATEDSLVELRRGDDEGAISLRQALDGLHAR